ncbi:predicted dinucleotide-binding enzyme [Sanguibacter keddieii DSM 10542]|uniref:Predicted dinucleotide-binding enzyme n=1 Tax=Sanguibacter keddieii (strain ATCC 51767 / DSM 10542 / NCFB 3025 / ST-74) TaxID=446469 RepID=D1BFL5_SANKS|nr:NAD(P)-binding domain-containing protein [Sanguibacter keddieii]ACZ23518.1 predicted dinucleotide-binding enzyme [Sanguibacter keddieii DSM 10542]
MTATGLTTIGLVGSGHIGSQLARLAVAHGYDVVVSNSRGPETLADLVAELGPRARAGTAQEAAEAGDLVVVTVPLKAYQDVPVQPLDGKVVIDTNNYYFERDGRIEALDREETTVSAMLQAHLPGSSVVKAFNNITAADLTDDSSPTGTPDRRALPIASDDEAAKALVTTLLDELGFDAVDAGTLAESWRFERDRPAYVVRMTATEVPVKLAEARRGA